jgi:hypothetical protein
MREMVPGDVRDHVGFNGARQHDVATAFCTPKRQIERERQIALRDSLSAW